MMTREEGAQKLRQYYRDEGRRAAAAGIGIERCPYTPAAPPDREFGVQSAVEWLHGWHGNDNANRLVDAIMSGADEVLIHGPPVPYELQLVFGGFGGDVTGVVALDDGIRVAYESGQELIFAPKERK